MEKKKKKPFTNTLGFFILMGCAIVTLFLIVNIIAYRYSVTSTEAYEDAMRRVRTSPRIMEKLGAAVSAGWWISSSRGWQGAASILEFSLSISGPKGSGTLSCRARLTYREWSFDLLEVKIDGKPEVVDLR